MAFALLACGLAPQPASAHGDLVEWVEIYEDETGTETIEQIVSRPFTRSHQGMNEGFSNSVFWLRIKLKMTQGSTDDIVVKVFPASAGSVAIYQRDLNAPGTWLVHAPFDDLSGALHGVHVNTSTINPVVYLRVSSVGTLNLTVSAYGIEHALTHTVVRTALFTGYLAALLMLALWAVRMGHLTRDPIFLTFALLQFLWILHNLFAFGLMQAFAFDWLDQNREPIYRLLVLSVSFLTVAFHHRLLGTNGAHRAVLLALRAMQLFILIDVVLYLSGLRHEAMFLNAQGILALPFLLLGGALTIRGAFPSDQWQVKAVYVAYSLLIMFWSLGITGHFRSTLSVHAALIIHGTSTSLLIFVVLNAHSRRFLRRLSEAETSLHNEQVRSRVQQEQNKVLARFIDMLAHETRNAHAVVRMNLAIPQFTDKARGRIASTLTRLDAIIERSVQLARLEEGSVVVQKQSFPLTRLLEEMLSALPVADRVDLVCDAPETVFTDRLLLKVALSNLVENALKYSPADSRVRLNLSKTDGQVSFAVLNDLGNTVAPSPDEVFQKLHRGAGTAAIPGTGLGLYLVQTIAGLLGGQADYSQGGRTVQFTLRIPC
jgi:signal transduction histidine kinase